MKVSEKNRINTRIYVVSAIFAFCFFIITLRAFQLQIIEGKSLKEKAKREYIDEITVTSKRGTIFDRNGKELAVSIDAKSIYARPFMIEDKENVSAILSKFLGDSEKEILKRLRRKKSFVWIKRRIPEDVAEKLMALKIKGIGAIGEARRYYPAKEIAAHLIGFVGVDEQGLEGIERRYDEVLRGRKYKLIELKDALGRPFCIKTIIQETTKNLILTIDREIQFKVQKELKAAVEREGARSGQAIILDPYKGEVLAMAVYPEFNPNLFWKYKPSFWRNRVITDCYEPGSVIKPFLVAAAIEEGVVTSDTVIFCENGSYKVADHIFHDLKRYGDLKVSEIIMVSSNIGAIKIGEMLGYQKFCDYLRRFGFGKKTGIDLIGERTGWIREVPESRPVDQRAIFFGQGISVTSIQLATAMAAIANGGLLLRPYVVKKIVDSEGNVLKERKPRIIRRVISEDTAKKVKRMMELVVKKGTGRLAMIEGFSVAGKTGTAQKVDPKTGRYSQKKYVSIFIGFVPVERPKILALVLLDEPKGIPYGGVVCAPVFRRIVKWTLAYLGISPKRRFVFFKKYEEKRKRMVYKKGFLPDLRGMTIREVLRIALKNRIRIKIKGTGFAVRQIPKPGTPVKKINVLKVYFSPRI